MSSFSRLVAFAPVLAPLAFGCGSSGVERANSGGTGAIGTGGAGFSGAASAGVAGTSGTAGQPSGGASGKGGSSSAGDAGSSGAGGSQAGSGNDAGAAGSADVGGEGGAGGSPEGEAGAPGTDGFVHPGCLSTQSDLDRMKAKVMANEEPWKGSWDKLIENSHAQLEYDPNPQATICAGGPCDTENYMTLAHDAAAAYQLALRYHVSGDADYADKAAEILDAWATTLTSFDGDSNAGLRAALYGYQLASAGELLRDHPAWDPAGLQDRLTALFYPIHSGFLTLHNGACEGNYWANWDLANMAAVMAIGVFTDRRDIFDEAVEYFHNGVGEGSINNAVHYVHPDGSGQWQESGRDQGHSTLGPMLMAVVCEIAWNQGIDLYAHGGNRLLLGSEYVAAYNLGNEVPYVAYTYSSGPEGSCNLGVQPVISASGRPSSRAGFELLYHHYVNRRGIAAPFTAEFAAQLRPEGGGGDYGNTSGGFDSLGFTTLTHALDPIATGAVPSALRPFVEGPQINLSWSGSAYATGYNVKRSLTSGGPYELQATVTTGRTNLVDAGLTPGVTYYYVVSALTPAGESADSLEAAATATDQLFGTVIGTAGSFESTGATRDLVFDGSLKNFFDAPDSVSWAGLDLGEGVTAVPTMVKYTPRKHFGSRMLGGIFQASNTADFSGDVTDLFTISVGPPDAELTTQPIQSTESFRYFRYLAPSGAYGNVAEVQFYGRITS